MPLPPLSEVAHVHGSSGRHRASGSTRPRPRLATAGAVTTLTAVAVAVTVTTVGGDDARTGSAQAASRVAASVPAAAPVALAPAAVAPAPAEDTSSLLARRSSRLDRADRSVRTFAVPRALYRAATTPSTVTVPAAGGAAIAATQAKPAPPAWVGPMGGPYRLTSRFGPRWGGVHHGLDFAAPIGTPLRSLSTGVVTDVKTGHGVYGTYIDVTFTDGSLARYAHLSRADVALGAKVGAGQTIGLSGNSGRSTGPHLHLEIHPHGDPNLKDAADPEIELRKRRVGV
ncbi:M23 family metallopeptidase [Arsenicicoccus bolidensis]|uniref:M23 family metallopeptidase n=1 Tax=Arsenicicoccus bolidensis TaxID=229480 RepID=A0ABS9Q6Z6_9MICO|nr:M23 family metallopeptidase [Arsenicicoccus bolidensis]MCG7323643.1 M23 family metallopeptidase [Arsenicicoccus bolidensis]